VGQQLALGQPEPESLVPDSSSPWGQPELASPIYHVKSVGQAWKQPGAQGRGARALPTAPHMLKTPGLKNIETYYPIFGQQDIFPSQTQAQQENLENPIRFVASSVPLVRGLSSPVLLTCCAVATTTPSPGLLLAAVCASPVYRTPVFQAAGVERLRA
jgi:hypothetical protein